LEDGARLATASDDLILVRLGHLHLRLLVERYDGIAPSQEASYASYDARADHVMSEQGEEEDDDNRHARAAANQADAREENCSEAKGVVGGEECVEEEQASRRPAKVNGEHQAHCEADGRCRGGRHEDGHWLPTRGLVPNLSKCARRAAHRRDTDRVAAIH